MGAGRESLGLGVQPAGRAVRLEPSLREKLWGKTRLRPWFADSPVPIGEAWFLSEQRTAPAGEADLHLRAAFRAVASRRWRRRAARQDRDVAHPGGRAGRGDRAGVSRADHARAPAASGAQRRNRAAAATGFRCGPAKPTSPRRTRCTPSAPGIVLCEIQQNSDVTYRLWDYGRPRELHLDKAAPLAELGVHPGPVADGVVTVPAFRHRAGAAGGGGSDACRSRGAANCGSAWTGRGPSAARSFARARSGCCRKQVRSRRSGPGARRGSCAPTFRGKRWKHARIARWPRLCDSRASLVARSAAGSAGLCISRMMTSPARPGFSG